MSKQQIPRTIKTIKNEPQYPSSDRLDDVD